MSKPKNWLTYQAKELHINHADLAKSLGVSRPTLYTLGTNPLRLTAVQVKTLKSLGFAVPGDAETRPIPDILPVRCPTCIGTGWLFRAISSEEATDDPTK